MKIGWRVAVFLLGAGVFFFSWHRAHNEMVSLQTPANGNSVGSAEVLVVVAGFIMLMAFAPTQEMLGRWMALKRPRKAHPAHFRRRRG